VYDHYQIRMSGHIDLRWSDWFDGLTITMTEDGDTLLTGPIRDQAQLHGLLAKVRDLALPLVSVNPVQQSRESWHWQQLNPAEW
jgi:hypothetical protein